MPEDHKKRLVSLVKRYQVPVIEDDIYGELHFGPTRPMPIKFFDTTGLILYCSSFSKTLAPDFRVGWIVPGRFKETIIKIKFNSSITSTKLPQLTLADYLQNSLYDRHLRRLRTSLKNQVSSTIQAIARHFPGGTKSATPAGSYILWVELNKKVDAPSWQPGPGRKKSSSSREPLQPVQAEQRISSGSVSAIRSLSDWKRG